MNYDVVVVGGGIGGLTTAALLAARGVKVALFERQSQVGGCVANFEHLGYRFEPTAGLYSGWESGGIYDAILSGLHLKAPEIRRPSPAYIVRLPDQTEVPVGTDAAVFEQTLREVFPECADAAVSFYFGLTNVAREWLNQESSGSTSDRAAFANSMNETAGLHLDETSPRFRRFVDVQLQQFIQTESNHCSYLEAALALTAPQRGFWQIHGGAQALADTLVDSFKKSGGTLRLDAPVLRLAYGSDGAAVGIDLLSGERVTATRAIVSNLTIWDTYGKLVGLSRTPPAISAQLRQLRSWGAYLVFLGMDESVATRLSSNRILALTDWQTADTYAPDEAQLMFAAAPSWDPRAPKGKQAVTVSTFTRPEDWFAFHENEEDHEEQDQAMLETIWGRLHSALPELGDSVEVIETATPRTFYETTRRKLGMVGKPFSLGSRLTEDQPFGRTPFPNVFFVGDTACAGSGLEAVCASALALANALAAA